MNRTLNSSSSWRRWAERLGAALVGAAALQLLGPARMRSGANEEHERAECPALDDAEGAGQRTLRRSASRRSGPGVATGSFGSSAPALTETEQEDIEAFRRGQSRELLAVALRRLAAQAHSLPFAVPEGAVNGVTEYLLGMSQGIERAAPELVMAMSAEIESAICGGEQRADVLMMYARMFRAVPALASSHGLDCFFAQRTAEDPVLWEGLDAWRGSGLPMPKGVEALQAKATMPQTRLRFMDPEELARAQAEPDLEPPLEPMEMPALVQSRGRASAGEDSPAVQ